MKPCLIGIIILGISLSAYGQQKFDFEYSSKNSYRKMKKELELAEARGDTASRGSVIDRLGYTERLTKKISANFYTFNIPSIINGTNLDPNPVTNINANFSESKIAAKVGWPFREKSKLQDFSKTGFIGLSVKATNGVNSLYKYNASPIDYGLSGGYSFIRKHGYAADSSDVDSEGNYAAALELVKWINILGTVEQNNYILFDLNAPYDQVKQLRTTNNYSLLVTFNRYFYASPGNWWRNSIISFGFGVARINNYGSLSKRSYEFGKTVTNSGTGTYKSLAETASGAVGTLIEYEGMAYYLEYFKTIMQSNTWGSIYWGNRWTHYDITGSDPIVNASSGFYFALKDGNAKAPKDRISFSVLAQFNRLNAKDSDYWRRNFTVVLQAGVPLRFN